MEPWKARQVAQATHTLSKAAAAYVDEQLAPRLASCGFAAIQTTVAMAIAKYHPELLEEKEKQGRKGWHVTLRHPAPGEFDGTSYLDVAGDTLDLTAFHDLVCDQAAALKALGDTDDLEIRKAKALGVIATQQATLDLITLTGHDDSDGGGDPVVSPIPVRRQTVLYAHASLTDLLHLSATLDGTDESDRAVGRVEKLGPATVEKIRDWLARSEDVVIRPVLDLNRCPAVDGHDPSEEIREIVILRDGHCVFPWCTVDARRTDQDHIVPYVPIDVGGPPGQTNPHNLACLCRRHHRCKTSGRWRYRRRPDGTYEWHGPHGRSYLVTPLGTLEIHPNSTATGPITRHPPGDRARRAARTPLPAVHVSAQHPSTG